MLSAGAQSYPWPGLTALGWGVCFSACLVMGVSSPTLFLGKFWHLARVPGAEREQGMAIEGQVGPWAGDVVSGCQAGIHSGRSLGL